MNRAELSLQQPVVQQLTAGALIRDSFRLARRALAPLFAVATYLTLVHLMVVRLTVSAVGARGWLVVLLLGSFVASMLAYGVTTQLFLSAARGDDDGLVAALTAAFRSLVPLCVCSVLVTACVWVGLALFIVPGVILALGWSLAAPAMLDDELGPFEALRDSWSLTGGHRFTLAAASIATALSAGFLAVLGAGMFDALAHVLPRASTPLHAVGLIVHYAALSPLFAVPVVARLRLIA